MSVNLLELGEKFPPFNDTGKNQKLTTDIDKKLTFSLALSYLWV